MKYVICTALAVFLAGCLGTRDALHRWQPIWPAWSLKTEQPDPDHLIRYDCIYVCRSVQRSHPGWWIVRFWRTGHMMNKLVDDYTDLTSIDLVNFATIGYYRVEGRHLTMESFVSVNGGQYGYGKFRIENDGSITSLSMGYRISKQIPIPQQNFKPVEVGVLTLQPDW